VAKVAGRRDGDVLHGPQRGAHPAVGNLVVRIDEGEEVTVCTVRRAIAHFADAMSRQVQHLGASLAGDLRRWVRGSVVGDDHLDRRALRTAIDGGETAPQPVRIVADRNNERKHNDGCITLRLTVRVHPGVSHWNCRNCAGTPPPARAVPRLRLVTTINCGRLAYRCRFQTEVVSRPKGHGIRRAVLIVVGRKIETELR
jgi:hypothetical protein